MNKCKEIPTKHSLCFPKPIDERWLGLEAALFISEETILDMTLPLPILLASDPEYVQVCPGTKQRNGQFLLKERLMILSQAQRYDRLELP